MIRLLLAALLIAASWPVAAQVGIINGQTPTVGFTTGQCVTIASNGAVTGATCGGAPSGSAGGSLTGTYPNPTLAATIAGAHAWSGVQAFAGVSATVTALTISAGVINFDVSLGTVFTVPVNANITSQTFSNVPAAKAVSFEVDFTANGSGFTQAWPCSFPGAVTPTLSTVNGKIDRVSYYTNNGGSLWLCTVISQNY